MSGPSDGTAGELGPVLLVGSAGMLGQAWQKLLDRESIAYRAVARQDLDITHEPSVREILAQEVPAVVINTAAYTNVDGAEDDEDGANAVNGTGVANLAEGCAACDALLVNYSTDYVFNGQADEPYPVDGRRDPINAYGRSKALGEAALEDSNCRWLNLRTSWLYAPWGKNFVLTMAKLTAERETLQVVDDQRGRPTSCEHLAELSLGLIRAGVTEHAHATDGGECTWHGFTVEIAKQLGHRCNIEPCGSDQYPRPAERPGYSVLDVVETEAVLGALPDWRSNLRKVLSHWDG